MQPRILGFLTLALVLFAGPSLAGTSAAPATQDGADVYYGELAIRSVGNGYLIAIEGDWGSRNFFFRSLDSIETLAEIEDSGKVVYSPRELLVILPTAKTLVRLVVPREDEGGLKPPEVFGMWSQEQHATFLSRVGAERLVENVEGYELAILDQVRPGLEVGALSSYSQNQLEATVRTSRGLAGEAELGNPANPLFFPTPPEDPNGGGTCTSGGPGSDSCSKTCTSSDSCSVHCRSGLFYACCYCSSNGFAYCSCRLSSP